MTVERSERGALTTNADYNEVRTYYLNKKISTPNQWTQVDNYTISYRFNGELPYAPGGYIWQRPEYLTFSGYSALDYELVFSVIVWYYNTSTKQFESAWYDNNTKVQINGDMEWADSPNLINSYEVYVRRKDGNTLSRQDMRPCVAAVEGSTAYRIVYTTAIPQNWLQTTTASFQNPMDTYTTIIPTDYDISSSQYDPLLEIPSKIDTAINFIILGFGRIMNFRYISFVVCFVLIVGLVAWLIH